MTQSLSTPDRLQGALRSVNKALNPRDVFDRLWEYAVIVARPGPPVTIDCAAVDPETVLHLPAQLVNVVLWPGPSGFVAQPAPGSIVRIGFLNGDPAKFYVAGLDPNVPPILVFGFVSATMQLGDQTAKPVVPAPWGAAVDAALLVLAAALVAAGAGPLAPLAAMGNALGIALTPIGSMWPGPPPAPGTLPPGATVKVLAT